MSRIFAFAALSLCLVVALLSLSRNVIGVADQAFWESWQVDGGGSGTFGFGQATVANKIEHDLRGEGAMTLGFLHTNLESPTVYYRLARYAEEFGNAEEDIRNAYSVQYSEYKSSVGAYGYFQSFLYRFTPLDSISKLRHVNALLFLGSVSAFIFAMMRLGGAMLALSFAVAIIGSPWITSAAPNLYWSPWLWYLPVTLAIWLSLAHRRWLRVLIVGLLFGAFLVKFVATGYEIWTSLVLLAAAMPLLAYFVSRQRDDGGGGCQLASEATIHRGPQALKLKTRAMQALTVCLVGSGAFLSAIAIHAWLIGDTLVEGLLEIWNWSVLRRTYGNPGDFPIDYQESLTASPFEVLAKYVVDWQTPVLVVPVPGLATLVIPGAAFVIWSALSFATAFRSLRNQRRLGEIELFLLAAGMLVVIAWLVPAKGHSYIHTHILFFLWYLLFIPGVVFVCTRFLSPYAVKVWEQIAPFSRKWNSRQ